MNINEKMNEIKVSFIPAIITLIMSILAFVIGLLYATPFIIAGAVMLLVFGWMMYQAFSINKAANDVINGFENDREKAKSSLEYLLQVFTKKLQETSTKSNNENDAEQAKVLQRKIELLEQVKSELK